MRRRAEDRRSAAQEDEKDADQGAGAVMEDVMTGGSEETMDLRTISR